MLGRKKTCVLEPVMFRCTQYGKAWVFCDTIEHEARNDSDELRVVLIFDVRNPQLTSGARERWQSWSTTWRTSTASQAEPDCAGTTPAPVPATGVAQ
jgi:hypothetical protein